MRSNEYQERPVFINLKDQVIAEIRVSEECYGPCDTCDHDERYYKISFTVSNQSYLSIYLKASDTEESRSISDIIQFFCSKLEDFEDMTWEEFVSEIKRFHGLDERELV